MPTKAMYIWINKEKVSILPKIRKKFKKKVRKLGKEKCKRKERKVGKNKGIGIDKKTKLFDIYKHFYQFYSFTKE